MSSAWEILEKQSKAKVDDAAAWEAKFSRLSVEVIWTKRSASSHRSYSLLTNRKLKRSRNTSAPCGNVKL